VSAGWVFDGSVFDGSVFDGSVFDGWVFDGWVFDGWVFDGCVLAGDVLAGDVVDGGDSAVMSLPAYGRTPTVTGIARPGRGPWWPRLRPCQMVGRPSHFLCQYGSGRVRIYDVNTAGHEFFYGYRIAVPVVAV
jgi:hypothetical protein